MKKTYHVTFKSMLFYTVLTFLSNYISVFVVNGIINMIMPTDGETPSVLLLICALAIYILIGLSVPLLATFFYFRSVVADQYIPSEDEFCWAKSCARVILPAETIRFLVCLSSLGHINQSGNFAFLPTLLFENTYLLLTNRHEPVRQMLDYHFADFVAYAFCYLLYIVIYLALVMLIYKRFWAEAKKDSEDLIVKDSNVKFY